MWPLIWFIPKKFVGNWWKAKWWRFLWTKEKWWSLVISSTSKGKNQLWITVSILPLLSIFSLDRNFVKGFLPSGNFSWRCFWKRIAIHAISSSNKGNIKFFQGCFADNLRMCEGRFYIHFNLVSVWFTKNDKNHDDIALCAWIWFEIQNSWWVIFRPKKMYPFDCGL